MVFPIMANNVAVFMLMFLFGMWIYFLLSTMKDNTFLHNDGTDRRGRPVASELEADVARPRSVQ